MQLSDLVKTIDFCSDEELLERLRKVRHNREHARPVARAKAAKLEKKSAGQRVSTLEKLVDKMSAADKARLLESLLGDE